MIKTIEETFRQARTQSVALDEPAAKAAVQKLAAWVPLFAIATATFGLIAQGFYFSVSFNRSWCF